jgi:hypothetical protein
MIVISMNISIDPTPIPTFPLKGKEQFRGYDDAARMFPPLQGEG